MINVTAYNLNQPSKVAFGNSEKPAVKYSPKQLPTSVSHQKPSSNSLMKGFKALMVGTAATVATVFGGGCSSEIDAPTPPAPPKPGPDTSFVVKDNRTVSEKAYQWLDSLGIKPTVTTRALAVSDGDSLVITDEKLNQKNAYGFHPNAKGDTIHVNMTETDLDGKFPAKDFGKMYQKDGNILMDIYDQNGKFNFTRKWVKNGLNVIEKDSETSTAAYKYAATESTNSVLKTLVKNGTENISSKIVKVSYYFRK